MNHTEPSIRDIVSEATSVIGPVWPLESGIACNPLLGWEHKNFWKALKEAKELFATQSQGDVNFHLIKWLQAFLDEGQALFAMPDRHLGFYRCWRLLSRYDRCLIKSEKQRKQLTSFPQDPEEALKSGLHLLGIDKKDWVPYLSSQIVQLPGWAGYVKYKSQWQSSPSPYSIDLLEFLAVRIAIVALLDEPMSGKKGLEELWTREKIEKEESFYQTKLIQSLSKKGSVTFFL